LDRGAHLPAEPRGDEPVPSVQFEERHRERRQFQLECLGRNRLDQPDRSKYTRGVVVHHAHEQRGSDPAMAGQTTNVSLVEARIA